MVSKDSPLIAMWQEAAADLELDLAIRFKLLLPPMDAIEVPVKLKNFGAPRGMLLVTDFGLIRAATSAMGIAGFGYSVMSAPVHNDGYDRESLIEILVDWGWSGLKEKRPVWLSESRDSG